MISLRPYQEEARVRLRVALRSSAAVFVVMPTGAGKTALAAVLISLLFSAGKRVLFCIHRVELIRQTASAFEAAGIPFSYVASGHHYNPYHRVFIASIATLKNRLGRIPADYVFVDEAHLSMAAGWKSVVSFYKAAGAKLIGLSATPERLDGKPLGDIWETLVMGPTTRWLIENGHLSKYRAFAPAGVDASGLHTRNGDFIHSEIDELMSGRAVLAGAVKHWRKYAVGKRTIAFAPSVARSEQLAEEFRSNGIVALHVDGNTPTAQRKKAFEAFADRQIDVITNVGLFNEGLDLAAQVGRDVTIEAALLYRPTQSLALHLQQIGRALRKKPEPAIILDLVGNLARLGLPDEERQWSLDGRQKKTNEEKVSTCPACFASHDPSPRCPDCGHAYAKAEAGPGRVLGEVEGELEELDVEAIRTQRKREQGMAQTLDDLVSLATARGYKSPKKWAVHVYTARKSKERIGVNG